MENEVIYIRGKPIEKLTKAELLEALRETVDFSFRQHEHFKELTDFIDRNY